MVERLRAKPGGDAITVTIGDMSELELADDRRFAVVFVAFNTFFNLPTEAAQLRCLQRVAALLAPEGRFVLEAFVPDGEARSGVEGSVVPRRISADEVVLAVTSVDRSAQTITGSHVHLTEAGTRLRPWHLRYATPAQLDDLAAAAGLVLDWRHGGWHGEPFTSGSDVHVCAYGRAPSWYSPRDRKRLV